MMRRHERGPSGTGKENPRALLCDRPSQAGPASLVRGSSRRITIMQAGQTARSANIRVINRRRLPARPSLGSSHSMEDTR